MPDRTRRRLARALVVLGALCLLFALPFAYLDRNLFEADGFADNAAAAVQDDAVRTVLAEKVTQELQLADPRVVSAAPLLTSGLEAFLETSAARSIIRAAAIQTHNAFVSRERGSLIVDLANLGIIAGELLRTRDPALADKLERSEAIIVPIADRSVATQVARVAEDVRILAIVLPILALLLFTVAQWLTPGRRRAAGEIGLAIFLVGIAALTLSVVFRGLILTGFEGEGRDVALGVLDAFTGSFTLWCVVVAVTGAIIAASAMSLTEGVDPADVPRLLWTRITRPRRSLVGEVIGALLLIGLGALIIADPAGAVRLAATVVGAYFVFAGVVTLLGLIVGPAPAAELEKPTRRELRRAALPWALGAVALVGGTAMLMALVVVGRSSDEPRVAAAASRGCNGSPQLCDRRFDRVTLPTSHNAMSTAQDGFVNANHGLGTIRQLDRGVRGLLVDAYMGQRNREGVVRTDLAPKAVEIVEARLGADGLAAVQRLAGRAAFGPIEGEKQLYFCHIVCELGAVEGVPFLTSIREWLDRNPNEVLSMMIEDAAPTQDIKGAFEESGLAEYANDFQPGAGRTFPTLREMLRSGKRLWVAAEERGESGTWYHRGYDVTQETPFSFGSPADVKATASCRPNRGPDDAPLLLLNHWVETYPPNPRNADLVNDQDVLVSRAQRCARERGRWPHLLAVDFVERGDVVAAAAELNGVAAPAARGPVLVP